MTLYESNYVRLRALMPQLLEGDATCCRLVSHACGDIPLHVAIHETTRYTSTLRMTYFFADAEGPVADPDLDVRIYHDARMAEALACGPHHRHPLFTGYASCRGSELERRWSRNTMLNKWLEYCADRGHLIGPARPADAPGAT
jgi:hypothetical protein